MANINELKSLVTQRKICDNLSYMKNYVEIWILRSFRQVIIVYNKTNVTRMKVRNAK